MVSKTVRTISKKQLRILFSYTESRISTQTLRKNFITNEFIIELLGITLQEYKRIKQFNYQHTQIIVNHFKIEPNEIEIQEGII
jgi:hypothetical protein